MSRVKREHYVPQSYLIAFSNNKNQVNVFDKSIQKRFISNVDKVAAEGKYFHFEGFDSDNEIVNKLNDEQFIEKFFSSAVEGEYKQILDRIRARATLTYNPMLKIAITEEERVKLAVFLTIQMIRAKDFRQNLMATSNKLSKAILENDSLSEKVKRFVNEINLLDEKVIQASMLFDNETVMDFSEVIFNHIWVLYINTTDTDFITSDNPVVRNAHIHDSHKSYGGLSSEGVEIAFPISSKVLLAMYEKSYHHKLAPCNNRQIVIDDNQLVDYYNYLQLSQSFKQIYSLRSLDPLILKVEKEYPDALVMKSKVDLFHNGKKY